MKIGVVAGEASGDLLGAKLIESLKQAHKNLEIVGIGGPAMIAAGCNSLFDIEKLSVMGFIEPLKRLPELIKLRRDLYSYFKQNKPDVFIGIDAPDFNLGLEGKLRRAGIPVVHYVSPSVWAWRQYRIHKIARSIDLMLTLLPFEAEFYEKHHVPVKYVGHPLADQIPLDINNISARRSLCIEEEGCYIALLPGSRKQELAYMSEPFILAAKKIWQRMPNVKFLTSHVNEKRYQTFYSCFKKLAPELPISFYTRRSQDVLAAADFAVVTSGTVTLEAMLFKKPMVIAYRMSNLTYQLAKRLVKSSYIGLPNLLANKLLVPELIQDAVTPDQIANHIFGYIDSPSKVMQLKAEFRSLHMQLQPDAGSNIEHCIADVIDRRNQLTVDL